MRWLLLGLGDCLGALIGAAVWFLATLVGGSFHTSSQALAGGIGVATIVYLAVLFGAGVLVTRGRRGRLLALVQASSVPVLLVPTYLALTGPLGGGAFWSFEIPAVLLVLALGASAAGTVALWREPAGRRRHR
jgi:hypothetical protein